MSSTRELDRTVPAGIPEAIATDVDVAPTLLADRYEIMGLLGVGGMGAVYRAQDRELGEVVALKMLRRELGAMPEMLERFRAEVRLARKVTSPHVARTFDIGEHQGERFLTMELVDGASLEHEIAAAGGKLPTSRVVAIAIAVCEGLSAAHAAGIVHRDLKPENILVARDGTLKITDFGIATAQVASEAASASGTPGYMAPEQVTAEPNVDARADLYALGVMLFEMLTGELPWKGTTVFAIASARLLADPPDVRSLAPHVPAPLAELVLRCMARSPSGRPGSAREVAEALAALATTPSSSPKLVASVKSAPETKGVAVVPLENLGGPDDAYIADAVTDAVIDALTKARGLRVWARRATAKCPRSDARQRGRELGADVVVDGTVERRADAFRITLALTSVQDGFRLWGSRMDRPFGDLLVAGEEVARAVALALAAGGSTATSTSIVPASLTRDPETVDLYVRARQAYSRGENALPFFERALAKAPNDPLVLAGTALARIGIATPAGGLALATEEAIRAVALAPHLPEARLALAQLRLHNGLAVEAAKELRVAIDLAPSSTEANRLVGGLLLECGAFSRAISHFQLAQQLDPTSRLGVEDWARAHGLLGEWERHDELSALGLEIETPWLRAVHLASRMRFSRWRHDDVMYDEARRALAAFAQDNVFARYWLGMHDGLYPPAPEVASQRRKLSWYQGAVEMAASRGQTDVALAALERCVALGFIDIAWFDRCPAIDPLRSDPRFTAAHDVVRARAAAVLDAFTSPA